MAVGLKSNRGRAFGEKSAAHRAVGDKVHGAFLGGLAEGAKEIAPAAAKVVAKEAVSKVPVVGQNEALKRKAGDAAEEGTRKLVKRS